MSRGTTHLPLRRYARYFRLAGCALGIVVLSIVSSEAKERKNEKESADKAKLLTRSIYLPIEFKVCEHLRDSVLYEGDQALGVLPARRIFQFTYYPTLDRVEPARTDLHVEGDRGDGSPFTGRLAITAWGVFTANHKIELDLSSQLQKMRYKLDVRYKPLVVRIACSDSCEKKLIATATTADTAAGPEKR